MNDKYTDLKNTIKAMTNEERAVVLSCIPVSEMLHYIDCTYSKLQDTVSKIEAITREE